MGLLTSSQHTLTTYINSKQRSWFTNVITIFFLFIFLSFGLSSNVYSDLDSQVFYESFDNEDAVVHANSDFTYVTGLNGAGKAVSTIGNSPNGNQIAQLTSDSTLPSDVRSISFWIKVDNSANAGNIGYIFSALSSGQYIRFRFVDDNLTFYAPGGVYKPDKIVFDGISQTYTNNSQVGDITLSDVADGNWHHFYIQFSTNYGDITKLYWLSWIDGIQVLETEFDELRYFNADLTDEEIAALAAGGGSAEIDFPSAIECTWLHPH